MSPTRSRRSGKDRKRAPREGADTITGPGQSAPVRKWFWMPLAFTALLVLVSFVDRVQEHSVLVWSFWGSAAALLAWQGWIFVRMKDVLDGQAFAVVLRPQHYLQATLQIAVFVYWGWYWRPVYDYAWLLAAQFVFAYSFSILLAWARHRPYILGFGPFPIVLSTNLFLWFRDDWFYLQFLMIAIGFLGKEFVRWNREGRRVHIFNPSAFSLGLFSVILIAMNASDLTWGLEIATTLTLAPRIYMFLFLIGLIAMYSFSITLVAGSAAVVLFAWSWLYTTMIGVPFFVDSEIPTAVFLGLHLLVTDPSTSPRTPIGKTIFGILYGVGVIVLFWGLEVIGVPTFYDKLLAVPLLNLSVQWIDHLAHSIRSSSTWQRIKLDWTPATANLLHMSAWITFFALMSVTGRTDGRHTGDSVPFWQEACEEGRRNACDRLTQLQYAYCADNSGWACNELGRHLQEGRIVDHDPDLAMGYFARACELRFQPGCLNVLEPERRVTARPRPIDFRVLLREGGASLADFSEQELYERACEHGWEFACEAMVSRSP